MEENHVSDIAIRFIKQNKKLLINTFASLDQYPREEVSPISIFMAGSPGAGKTEISKRLAETFRQQPVRIDADEIRTLIPQYDGSNSNQVQLHVIVRDTRSGLQRLSLNVQKIDSYVPKTYTRDQLMKELLQ